MWLTFQAGEDNKPLNSIKEGRFTDIQRLAASGNTQHGPLPASGMGPERRPTTPLIPPIAPSQNSRASAASDNLILDAAQDLFMSRSPSSVPSHADEPVQTPEYDHIISVRYFNK